MVCIGIPGPIDGALLNESAGRVALETNARCVTAFHSLAPVVTQHLEAFFLCIFITREKQCNLAIRATSLPYSIVSRALDRRQKTPPRRLGVN